MAELETVVAPGERRVQGRALPVQGLELSSYVRSIIARQAKSGFGWENIFVMLKRHGHAGVKDRDAVRAYFFEVAI